MFNKYEIKKKLIIESRKTQNILKFRNNNPATYTPLLLHYFENTPRRPGAAIASSQRRNIAAHLPTSTVYTVHAVKTTYRALWRQCVQCSPWASCLSVTASQLASSARSVETPHLVDFVFLRLTHFTSLLLLNTHTPIYTYIHQRTHTYIHTYKQHTQYDENSTYKHLILCPF